MHLAGEKILKLRSNTDIVFLSGGDGDTSGLALKRIDKLPYQQDTSSFHGSPFAKKSIVSWARVLQEPYTRKVALCILLS